jgi:hypothetical protein
VKRVKPQWRKLTLKEKNKLLRKGFFRTVRRMSKTVASQKQEEIEKLDFMKTARKIFSHYVRSRVNIPKTAKLYLDGKVVAIGLNGKRKRNLKRVRAKYIVKVTLEKVVCRVRSSIPRNPESNIVTDMRKHKFTYGFTIEKKRKKRIWARYASETAVRNLER